MPVDDSWVSNRIKQLRRARGLTLEEVAAGAATSLQQIQRLENGTRRLTDEWMRRIAPVLGVSSAALLADFAPDVLEFTQSVEEVELLRWWRLMPVSERRMIAAIARERGIEILVGNHTKKRSA